MLSDSSRQADFPSLAGRSYLNTAAEGIPPETVVRALHQYAEDKLLGMDGRELHQVQWEGAKREAASAYGLSVDEIGICSSSSEAFNLAAMALQLREGDEVVINDLDFPAGATPWLQDSCPARTRVWQARDGALRIEDLEPLLGPRTRLVTTSLVSFFNGYRIDVDELLATVRGHSPSLLALDVTQALGRIPLQLEDVDLVVSSTHKWILASHGGGLVGVPAARASEWTVPAGGWFHLQDAFGSGRFEQAASKPGAASFTVGMPNYAAVYAIHAALAYIRSVGVAAIDQQKRPLVQQCLAELKRLPVELLTPDEPEHLAGILAFRHPEAERLHQNLRAAGVHTMSHAGRLRVAIHGYNTAADIERLVQVLRKSLR